jgi:quinohemoprotein amine dehydrogenase
MPKRAGWLLSFAVFVCVLLARASAAPPPPVQEKQSTQSKQDKPDKKDEGIPIQSELVLAKCGSCHKPDEQKRMTRISYRRATPENWERTVKRMVTLNHVPLEPADARAIVKYLADHNGLAPEEARPIAFEAERRTIDFNPDIEKAVTDTCSSCHSLGRVMMERRTKDEWDLLVAMHRGYYPLVDMQPMNSGPGFRRPPRPPQAADAASDEPPDNKHPMDKAIAYFAKTYPLNTPEWSSWSAALEPVSFAGRWGLSGYAPGKGKVFGTVVITADPSSPDSYITETRYTIARTGQTVTRKGKSVVYTGFQWRGRSTDAGPVQTTAQSAGGGGGSATAASSGAAPTTAAAAMSDVWRETMFIERTRREMWGRWFTGFYDELGIDVKLTKLGADPAVFGASVTALKTGSSAKAVKIFGANLPASVTPADISLGSGVKVSRIVSATADLLTVEVDVVPTAILGPRDLTVAGAVSPAAIVVFDKVDGIRIAPQAGMARVGGAVFPKGYEQFEAIAFSNGPDGKPDTKDDWSLGIIDVKWALEEYTATFGDDDLKFVGTLDAATGLFTPNLDGPNEKRTGNRNNVGDVWVVGVLGPDAALGTTKPLRARAHLLVTVPVYMTWNGQQP